MGGCCTCWVWSVPGWASDDAVIHTTAGLDYQLITTISCCGKHGTFHCRLSLLDQVGLLTRSGPVFVDVSNSSCQGWSVQYTIALVGPIRWGRSGPLCHALLLSSLLSSSWTSMRACDSGDTWWMGMRRLAVGNGPNIFQMLLVKLSFCSTVLGILKMHEKPMTDMKDNTAELCSFPVQ